MKLPAPELTNDDHSYNIELKQALDDPVIKLVDEICGAGWSKYEAYVALTEVIREHALAHDDHLAETDDLFK